MDHDSSATRLLERAAHGRESACGKSSTVFRP